MSYIVVISKIWAVKVNSVKTACAHGITVHGPTKIWGYQCHKSNYIHYESMTIEYNKKAGCI